MAQLDKSCVLAHALTAEAMKPGIHPEYRAVVFRDASNGMAFVTRSTIATEKTIQWEDGNEYPLYTLEISGASHPFYTGTQRMLDTAGRVERFKQRYSGANVQPKPTEPAAKAAPKAAATKTAKAAAKPKVEPKAKTAPKKASKAKKAAEPAEGEPAE